MRLRNARMDGFDAVDRQDVAGRLARELVGAEQVREIFAEVGRQAQAAAERVRDIALAMKEQSGTGNVKAVARKADENSAAVGSVTVSAEQLQRLAADLKQRLAGFDY
jgi:methyl-accepting chemotaxis protein